MRLERNQCIVRDRTPADRDLLLECANNRKVWRNLGHRFSHPYMPSDADRWFSCLNDMDEPSHWAIEIDGRDVGGVGVDPGSGRPHWELLRIAPR
jgi:RimJ/RimL family protein N-acetyltransferase